MKVEWLTFISGEHTYKSWCKFEFLSITGTSLDKNNNKFCMFLFLYAYSLHRKTSIANAEYS